MYKRFALLGLLVLLVLAAVFVAQFASTQLRGITLLLRDAGEGVVERLKREESPFTLSPGFSLSVFAEGLEGPRVLMHGPDGNLWVSLPAAGKVVSFRDSNADGKADEVVVVAEGLNKPHGLATRCTEACEVFIAETNRVGVYDYDEAQKKVLFKREILALPSGGNHVTRSILFLPAPQDHRLLTSVGSTCNVCFEADSRRAAVLVSNADGSELEVFAKGLRNAVFMTLHPVTGDVWVTEMGRDLLGDDIPPDEINIVRKGGNYGWPSCFGKNVHDDEFDKNTYIRNPCMEPFETPAHIDVPAHSAPLGLAFVPEEGWPEAYWYNLFVAYHGSWNKSIPTGYKVVRYILNERGEYLGEEDFITGWFTSEGEVIGRPSDVLVEPGGVMYISDDRAGVIYRVMYDGAAG